MIVMAVDYGTKRLGVALGADGALLFSKTITAPSSRGAIAALRELIDQELVETLVLGLPLRLDGSEREEAREVRRFATQLAAKKHLPVVFVDERLTSEEAQSILREQGLSGKDMRGKIDQQVAELLLAQYYRKRS